MSQLEHIETIEKRLWSSADNLRANSNYASNEYFLPVMGLIFLRHAYSRYLAVKDAIEASLPQRGGKTRPLTKEDFSKKSSIFLRPEAQFDSLVSLPDSANRAQAIINAMESIEADYETLKGVLPKGEYQELDNAVLGQLVRTFNDPALKAASGDIFGRIYEYFLTQFADLKAHDNGEFFTPVSLVQMIVNVIEPDHGKVLDPACGSGGMFVQSAHFIERLHQSPSERVTFYGMEKNATTIRLAKMNLAVHGLEGNIQKAITYYEDPHELLGKADFVMANPPFNVDEVDADKVKNDPRLPFGLPGVNKKGAVSNGNYLWVSYFYSYLNKHGRAGFVMSSQASSAGRDEATVRRKLIEAGQVDVMIAIRSNFFYTRTVPCELWFIDKGKPYQPSPQSPLPAGEGFHYRGGYDFAGMVQRVRELREKQTPAESVFWELVRDRRFLGLKFRRQHQFGDYVLDFYCHECKAAIELDGPIHDQRKDKDRKRDAYLSSQGVKMFRFSNAEVLDQPQTILERLAKELPLPLGEGQGEGQGPLNERTKVLMIDARNMYRKVTRKIYDFSPEQLQNLSAIVWLYRGKTDKFLALVAGYLDAVGAECEQIPAKLNQFEILLDSLRGQLEVFTTNNTLDGQGDTEKRQAFAEVMVELQEAEALYKGDRASLVQDVRGFRDRMCHNPPTTNEQQYAARKACDPIAEKIKGLIKQVDLLYKLAARVADLSSELANSLPSPSGRGTEGEGLNGYDRRSATRLIKDLDTARKDAVEQLKHAAYFHRQVAWLQDRFPGAKLTDVPGLVKLVDLKEIAAADWSLTPGRYVGVAPPEEDEDFDFEEQLRDIHVELASLNEEAAELARKIHENFEELGV